MLFLVETDDARAVVLFVARCAVPAWEATRRVATEWEVLAEVLFLLFAVRVWVATGWAERVTGCATGLWLLFVVEVFAAFKAPAARHTPIPRTHSR